MAVRYQFTYVSAYLRRLPFVLLRRPSHKGSLDKNCRTRVYYGEIMSLFLFCIYNSSTDQCRCSTVLYDNRRDQGNGNVVRSMRG